MDLLTTYIHNPELQEITAPLLISTVHKSQQYPAKPFSSLQCLHLPFPDNGF
jgi:hypothetical protein